MTTSPDRAAALEVAIVTFLESEAWVFDTEDGPSLCGGCGQAWDGSYDVSEHPVNCPVAALWRSVNE